MLYSMQVLEPTGVKKDAIDMWEIQDLGSVLPKITSNQHFACFSLQVLEAAGVKKVGD